MRERLNTILSSALAVLRAYWYFRGASHLGKKVRVWGKLSVLNKKQMIICDRVRIASTPAITELVSYGLLEIGEGTYINYGCSIAALEMIKIGPNCNIGPYSLIIDNNYHRIEPERRNERPESYPVILEENVWLGARVVVLPGVRIGAHSIIGAGSVVTKDIPTRVIAAGNPAKIIKSL
jgi:acetyltransferase-like isoleucine patch superfamily enzyme